jgi:hypothetical protein
MEQVDVNQINLKRCGQSSWVLGQEDHIMIMLYVVLQDVMS